MDTERIRAALILAGLAIAAVLVIGGFISGNDWVRLAGELLGLGTGTTATITRKAP